MNSNFGRHAQIVLILAIVSLFPEIALSQWIQWPASEGGNGHWYGLTATGTWQAAEAEAVANGGHLVTMNDQAEQDWLNATFPFEDGPLWTGFWQDTTDPGYSEPAGGWKWISGEPVTLTNWAGGEPNEAPPAETNEDRAQMHAFAPGRWQDVPGNATYALRRGIIEAEHLGPVWIEWSIDQGGNGHLYALTENPSSWQAAEDEAAANEGHLVAINDEQEQLFLNATFPFAGGPFWTGLYQAPGSDEPGTGWQWSNGDSLVYTNWASGEPNEAPPAETNEDRAQMHAFAPGRWQDVPGGASYAFRRGIIEVVMDICPDNPNKVAPGICGCDTPDADSDDDGTPDCNDGCPNDPAKVEPGDCGCGVDCCQTRLCGICLSPALFAVFTGMAQMKYARRRRRPG